MKVLLTLFGRHPASRRLAGALAAMVACAFVLNTPSSAFAGGKGNQSPQVLPPNSHAFGKPLSQWLDLYATELLERLVGTKTLPQQVGNVLFLQAPAQLDAGGKGHEDVTIKAGTALLYSTVFFYLETYEDGSTDDLTMDYLPQEALTKVEHLLDNRPILQNLRAYYIPTVPLENPVVYPEATDYGSISANWVQGFAFIITPLPVGVHTLTSYIHFDSDELGMEFTYDESWTITVVP